MQETRDISNKAAKRLVAAGPVRRGLIGSGGNGGMLLASTLGVTGPGWKDPCIPIKPEKLLKEGAKRCRTIRVHTKFYEESWSALSL